MNGVRVADLLDHLETAIPSAWAEPWDRVGLIVGDPGARAACVFVTLDPTPEALRRAVEVGADVLLSHHPVFLEAPERLAAGRGLKGVPYEAVRAGVALVAMHTNLDRAPAGADALARTLGLEIEAPLERSSQPVRVVVSYVPAHGVDAVLSAVVAAGGGRIGLYAGCSFTSEGTGRFTALEGASPCTGSVGRSEAVAEQRVEVVSDPRRADAVVAALRAAHPYEEPVVLVSDASMSRGAARMGRICPVTAGRTLGSLAEDVSRRLSVNARVRGDGNASVRRAAIAPGSGRSLVEDAIAAGCDAIVTGELRYHEALDAVARGLAVIEAGHDATEWPLTRVLASIARETPGMSDAAVVLDEPTAASWTVEGV